MQYKSKSKVRKWKERKWERKEKKEWKKNRRGHRKWKDRKGEKQRKSKVFGKKSIQKAIPCSPSVLLINDDFLLNLSCAEKYVYLAELTAAKKMLALCWKPPHDPLVCHWTSLFMQIFTYRRFQEFMAQNPDCTMNSGSCVIYTHGLGLRLDRAEK